MPAGVPWPVYLRALAASVLAMLAGAEAVHRYYRPDLYQKDKELPERVRREVTKMIQGLERLRGDDWEGVSLMLINTSKSIPEIPPKPGELKTELLGLKERSNEVQTSQQ